MASGLEYPTTTVPQSLRTPSQELSKCFNDYLSIHAQAVNMLRQYRDALIATRVKKCMLPGIWCNLHEPIQGQIREYLFEVKEKGEACDDYQIVVDGKLIELIQYVR